MEALYTPLTVANKGHFPLHSDLYIPRVLFNLFDEVPGDGSGASILLPMDVFRNEVLTGLKTMPLAVKKKIEVILDKRDYKDHYDQFYNLLNDPENAWHAELGGKLRRRRLLQSFAQGEGYMVHDRRWLHGRLRPSRALNERRVHRLVFRTSI